MGTLTSDTAFDRTTAEFVEFYGAKRWLAAPVDVTEAMRIRLADSVACAAAGRRADLVGGLFQQWSTLTSTRERFDQARLWGTSQFASAENAALVNGIALRYQDLSDTFRGLDGTHPSDALAALIAVAETDGRTLGDLILAAVASYQVQVMLADQVPFNKAGYDQPVGGALAVGIGVAHLMGLDAETFGRGITMIAVSQVPLHETRIGMVSSWKSVAAPLAASNAITCMRLAQRGFSGPGAAFDGVNGLWAQTVGSNPEISLAEQAWCAGRTSLKRWPVRDSCQIGVLAALDVHAQVSESKRIAKIEVDTYGSSYRNAVEEPALWRPATREAADHSLPIAIGLALVFGDVDAAALDEGSFRDQAVMAVLDRMTVRVNEDFDRLTPAVKSIRLTVTLDTDEQVVVERALREGEGPGLSDREIVEEKLNRYVDVGGAELLDQLVNGPLDVAMAEIVERF